MEFPNLCSKCLGNQENLRVIKQNEGECCKICTRPFDVYRWQVQDSSNRSKKTLICKTCSTVKNCCQSCMLDINFLIPLDIRDTALKMSGLDHLIRNSSRSSNSEVKAIMADKQDGKYDLMNNEKAKQILSKLANGINNTKPSKINPKAVASNDIPSDLAKTIKQLPFNGSLVDKSEITSFFIFGISEVPQYVITKFAETFGKLKYVSLVHNAGCGFIQFSKRKSAEAFAEFIKNNNKDKGPGLLILDKKYPVRVAWSEIKPLGNGSDHKKISLVVNKVMAELAKSKSKTKAIKNTSKSKANYEASQNDFEL